MTINNKCGDRNTAHQATTPSVSIRPSVLIDGRPILFVDSKTASRELVSDPVEIAWMSAKDGVTHRRLISPRVCEDVSTSKGKADQDEATSGLPASQPIDVAQKLSVLLDDHVVVATVAGVQRLRLIRLLAGLPDHLTIVAMGAVDVAMAIGAAARINSYTFSQRIAPAWARALLSAPPPIIVARTAKLVEAALELAAASGSDSTRGVLRLALPRQVHGKS